MGDMILTPGPLPGGRKLPDGKTEQGAVLAFRKDGDEVLYATDGSGLRWISVEEFLVNPSDIAFSDDEAGGDGPVEEEMEGEETAEPAEVSETPAPTGPFLRKRPTTSE